jgi:hypothetical protein
MALAHELTFRLSRGTALIEKVRDDQGSFVLQC